MNVDTFSIIIIVLVILVSYRIYRNSDLFQLKCIISDVDGEKGIAFVREISLIKRSID